MVFATRHRKLVILLFLFITGFFAYQLSNVKVGHDINDFFDKEEKVYLFNKEFFSNFTEDLPNSAIVGIRNKVPLSFNTMLDVDSFTKQLAKIPGVQKAFSVTNQQLALFSSVGTLPYDLLDLSTEENFDTSFLEFDSLADIKNKFISKDNKSILIYLQIHELVTPDSLKILQQKTDSIFSSSRKKYITLDSLKIMRQQIDSIASSFSFEEVIFVNKDHNAFLITKKIKSDSFRLVILAFTLIILILLYFFRSFVGVFTPFIIVVSSVIWIMGTITLFGFALSVLTIAIPVIVGVISLSDVIHIVSRYSEEKTTDKFEKIRITQKDILKAIILTTVTTSFGFLSLSNSNIQVFTEFSIFTAVGVFYAFFLAYFVLPVLLFYSKKITLHNSLHKLTPKNIWVKPTLIVTGVALVFCVLGIMKVKHNNFVYENMGEKDEITTVMNFMEQDMYGIRDLTVTVSLKDSNSSLFNKEVLSQLNKLETFIEDEYKATIEVGLATSAKQVNRALNGGFASQFKIPEEDYQVKKIKRKLIQNARALRLKGFVSRKNNSTFIKTKAKDFGSYECRKSNEKLLAFAKTNTPDLDVNFGGNAYIIDETNVNVANGMIVNLLIIVLFLFIIISIIFKSISIGFFSLFPNILPLIAITAVVGWFDFGMNIGTTIVYTIAFGIAVDDTIHFLGRYKIEIDKGRSNHESILTTIQTSGGAIFLTTLTLVAGFGVLILSNFYANFITGLLVTISLVVALICDLYLLPVILNWLRKGK